MHILNFKLNKFISPTFSSTTQTKNIVTVPQPQVDTVELSTKRNSDRPSKLELTDIEKEFDTILIPYNLALQNIETQKKLLKQYYSPQDRYDYKELIKEKNRLLTKLKHLAKKHNVNCMDIEYNIYFKKNYNYYSQKIHKARTIQELNEIQARIFEKALSPDSKKILINLIEQRKQELKH